MTSFRNIHMVRAIGIWYSSERNDLNELSKYKNKFRSLHSFAANSHPNSPQKLQILICQKSTSSNSTSIPVYVCVYVCWYTYVCFEQLTFHDERRTNRVWKSERARERVSERASERVRALEYTQIKKKKNISCSQIFRN